jgi:excisionase family DNA binding protein
MTDTKKPIKKPIKKTSSATEAITIYTLDEVAQLLKVTRRTVYNYVGSGELKAVKLGSDWRVKYKDLLAFIQALEYPKKPTTK